MPQPKQTKATGGRTVTVTAARPGTRRVRVGRQIFPVGEPVSDVSDTTIEALEAMPGLTVDVAGKPDADTPEPTTEE